MQNYIKKTITAVFQSLGLNVQRINRAPETFFEVDQDFNQQYRLAQQRTQMEASDNLLRRKRHYVLCQLLRQVDVHKGHVAECGCFRGLSAYEISTYLKLKNFRNKFYIFDSFEGLSEYQASDLENNPVKSVDERRKHFACSLDIVKSNLSEFSFIEFKKGWIPEKFKEVARETFSFVNIDVDLYQPIKDSLEFFYDRTVQGGIISLDDYGCSSFPGAKKAVDEFMKDKGDFFLSLPSGAAFLLKK